MSVRHAPAIGPLVILALMLTASAGCTATIVPPAEVREPRTVYLLDHGYTSSLVMPTDGAMARYAYGEHQWYALRETGFWRLPAVLGWSTQATLGHRRIDAPADPASIRQHVRVEIEQLHPVRVEADRVSVLLATLAGQFDAGAVGDRTVDAPESDLRFVPTSPGYHLFHNSNHVSAQWLEALDCEVRGPTVGSRWRVETEHE